MTTADANGLTVTSSSNIVRGLAIDRFRGIGILLSRNNINLNSNIITGNYVGTNAAGTAALANGNGIVISDSAARNRVGGIAAGEANTIAFNQNDGVQISTAGTGNDGVRLLIDGVNIIDAWTSPAPTENSATITLNAGQLYAIRMEHFDADGEAVARLAWSSPCQPKQIIPADRLYPFAGAPFAATADAYVKGATPDQNFGTVPELQVKRTLNPGSGKGRQAYLRFDTTSVAGTIRRATLRVYGRLNAVTANNVNVPCAVFPVSLEWTESVLTWNNKPQPNAPQELARVTVTDDTARWYEFDITAFLNSERAAGDFYTVFNSREATSNQPQLVIEQ